MKTLDDIRAALEGCEYEIQIGRDPVGLDGVSMEPGLTKLSWLKKAPVFIDGLRGVVVITPGTSGAVNATLIRTPHPRLVFARVAKRLFPPTYAIQEEIRGIGGVGFGFVRNGEGELERFPHYGEVRIGKDVQIGHFTCIDRGALTDTVIEDGVKLDNLVHIAHGAHIGAHTSIAALTCIEGSVKIGKRCTIGSNVTFQIGSGCGDDVTVGSGSVVTKFIPSGETWLGNPARRWK